jgi:hypothetical protein
MKLFTPSAAFVDAVCNHPRVRPSLEGGTRRLRANNLPVDCVLRAFDGGVGIFVPVPDPDDVVYEGHVAVHPAFWGRAALAFGKLAVTELFNDHWADRLEVVTSAQLPTAAAYCRRLGLKPVGRDLFQEYFIMEAESWAV